MTLFDLILLLVLAGFVSFGLWFGLIHTLGALIGIIFGVLVAGLFYDTVAHWTTFLFFGNLNVARVVCFLVIYIISNRLIGFVFYLVDRIFGVVAKLPFIKSIDRLAGAVLGFVEGTLILGGVLYVAARYPIIEWFTKAMEESWVAKGLLKAANILKPLLPAALKALESLI